MNAFGLVKVVAPVVTVIAPVSAPAGTVALIKVVPPRVMEVAGTPPNFTTEVELNPWPRMPTLALSLAAEVSGVTNGESPISKL